MHTSFLDGEYKWYGQGTEQVETIKEMTTLYHKSSYKGLLDVNSGNTAGNVQFTGVNTAFNDSGRQTDWYDDKTFENKPFLFRDDYTDSHFNLNQSYSDPFAGCYHGMGFHYEKSSNKDWEDYYAAGVYGEFWCTNVHKLDTFPDTRIYNKIHTYEHDSLEWIPRYDCSTILKSRVYIGNIPGHSSRVIVSPFEKYDTFSKTEYIDYQGDIQGDAIIELENFNDKLIVLKQYSTHIVNAPKGEEIITEPFIVMEKNGILKRHHVVKSNRGVAWFNKYGLWFFDGKTLKNLLEKDITIAENVTVNKKRITDTLWGSYFNHEDAFITYDGQKNQLIIGSNLDEVDHWDTDENGEKVEFIYDFTTKGFTRGASIFTKDIMCAPLVDDDGIPTTFKVAPGAGSEDILENPDMPESAFLKLDNDLENDQMRNVLLITKDLDFRDPARRKKFYRLYVTFKANRYHTWNQNAEGLNSHTPTGRNHGGAIWNSKIKVYYALDGTKNWKEFDFTKSTNYTDLGTAQADEGEHGLVVWEDMDQSIGTATLESSMSTTDDRVYLSGDQTSLVKAGMGLKIDDEVVIVREVHWKPEDSRTYCALQREEESDYNKRGLNSANPNAVTPSTVASHDSGVTAYVITNNWTQATLIPPSTDTEKNSFYSIQFKIESVKASDGTARAVPSRFEVNDMSVIYREKGLR